MNSKMCLTIVKKRQYRIWKNFSDWMSDSRLIAKNVKTGSLCTRSLITVRFLWNFAHCFSYSFCIYHLYLLLKILNLRYNKRKYLKLIYTSVEIIEQVINNVWFHMLTAYQPRYHRRSSVERIFEIAFFLRDL